MIKNDWHKRVYRRKIPNFITKDAWHKLRMACLTRDSFTCQRCGKQSRQGMQAHHMIPRETGGADDVSNLLTLCNSCHDIVEIAGYKTKAEIIGSIEDSIIVKHQPKHSREREYSFSRPEWHRYVYGGARHSD